MVKELRSRVASLQNELDNSEKVQKDFVLLSQSLQQELEKIRSSENEVPTRNRICCESADSRLIRRNAF